MGLCVSRPCVVPGRPRADGQTTLWLPATKHGFQLGRVAGGDNRSGERRDCGRHTVVKHESTSFRAYTSLQYQRSEGSGEEGEGANTSCGSALRCCGFDSVDH